MPSTSGSTAFVEPQMTRSINRISKRLLVAVAKFVLEEVGFPASSSRGWGTTTVAALYCWALCARLAVGAARRGS
jgi:hypothetical protein